MRTSLFTHTLEPFIVILLLTGGYAMSYESIYPRTSVGTIEIKTLPERKALVASAPGDAFEDRGAAFSKLFAYINDNQVAMSVPVSASVSTNEMVFYVGGSSTNRALASTNDVTVQTLPAKTVASIGLRGSYSREKYEEGLKELNVWLTQQQEWQISGSPYIVYWNSPFVPWFLRKSEIHIPVGKKAGGKSSFYAFAVETIDGVKTNLAPFQGQVVLVVNVASKCGFTSQYEGLQKLYETYSKQGLVLLGFPANDFLGQEPGTNIEIQQFCSLNYGVTFPLFSKIHVKGPDIHPLYAWLTDSVLHPGIGGPVSWNFNKFLVDRQGRLIARFGSRTAPQDKELIVAIEKALSE